jgi:hypothetical protein
MLPGSFKLKVFIIDGFYREMDEDHDEDVDVHLRQSSDDSVGMSMPVSRKTTLTYTTITVHCSKIRRGSGAAHRTRQMSRSQGCAARPV